MAPEGFHQLPKSGKTPLSQNNLLQINNLESFYRGKIMLDTEQIIKYAEEEHTCPHCQTRLACCNTPPIHVGDGLGWGTEIFFVCLNDECSLYKNGWEHVEAQYGHCASFRFVLLPGENKGTPMCVGSEQAFTGSAVDIDDLRAKNVRYLGEKQAVKDLDTCVEKKNLEPVLTILLDEKARKENRQRAADLLARVNDLSCIDPIRNHTFRDPELEHRTNLAITQILKASFRKECPQCFEIVKSQAKVCKECGADF